jgi:hypothetical protein
MRIGRLLVWLLEVVIHCGYGRGECRSERVIEGKEIWEVWQRSSGGRFALHECVYEESMWRTPPSTVPVCACG